MTSKVFEQLMVEQIEIFRNAYASVSRATFYDEVEKKLIHPYEFGSYREAICRDFLRFFIPSKFDVAQGFLINNNDEISTQCDIVIYDSGSTPLIQNESRQRFFPIETVVAVGEVKSKLTKAQLGEALNKLAGANAIRENTHSPHILWSLKPHKYNPENHLDDQLFTFLICESLDFKLDGFSVDSLYAAGTPVRHKHNMILSLEDGTALYNDKVEDLYCPYPVVYRDKKPVELDSCLAMPDEDDELIHFKAFATMISLGMTSPTILYPDITFYLGKSPGTKLTSTNTQPL